mmetsp:Transcript_4701/g.8015  ORF Transcript_4701/g.8015 Transcript_4701/m.8015 type:complete len:521 (+) Transcript_4701:1152-2714(+)
MTDQLFLCEVEKHEIQRLFTFGTTIEQKCNFDLGRLLSNATLPKYANQFFDVFIEDFNGDLIDVPVRVNNLKDEFDQPVNLDPDSDNWILTRRFFLFDTVSGIENNRLEVIRYATSIHLKFKLDPNTVEKIYPPLIEVTYQEKQVEALDDIAERQKAVSFISQFDMDTTDFWQKSRSFFIVLMIALVLVTLVFVYTFYQGDRLDTDAMATTNYVIGKSLFLLLDNFSSMFFWYLVSVTGWLFIFFKFQERAYYMIPSLTSEAASIATYKPFDTMLITLTVTKFIALAYKIVFEQSGFNFFVIDWEQPKKYYFREFRGEAVNPWRKLYVVNELNELQTTKFITPEVILLLFLVITEGFGVKHWAILEPQLSFQEQESPYIFILTFFVITIVIFGVGSLQYAITMLFKFKFAPDFVDFVDLCAVANVSILIFNEDLRGHYIHGKSPHGSADVSAEKLRLNLLSEANGNAHVRGISPIVPDAQTFEIQLPKNMIDDYKKNYFNQITEQVRTVEQENQKNYNAL